MQRRKLPTKEDYLGFINIIRGGLIHFPHICFYGYGSDFQNCRADVGRSDIDGGLIIDTDFIIDPQISKGLAKLFSQAKAKHPVKTNFNLLDSASSKDGRFLSYTTDYTDHIGRARVIYAGPEGLISTAKGLDFKSGVMYSAAFNFRKVRNAQLESFHLRQTDPEELAEKVRSSLECLAKMPKKLIWLQTGDLPLSRFEAAERLQGLLPSYDQTFLRFINELLKHPHQLFDAADDPALSIEYLFQSTNALERMVKEYVKTFPVHTKSELAFPKSE